MNGEGESTRNVTLKFAEEVSWNSDLSSSSSTTDSRSNSSTTDLGRNSTITDLGGNASF